MNTVVVNMFAGPGAGKTTCAWIVASELKKRGFITEYVSEYPKELVWDRNMEMLDGSKEHQLQILQEQEHRLQRLDGQVDFVVTDSPLLLNTLYLTQGTEPEKQKYADAVYGRFSRYHNFSVVIQRGASFETAGRIHDLEESRKLDNEIQHMLRHYQVYYGIYQHETVHKVADNCITTYHRFNQPTSFHSPEEGQQETLDACALQKKEEAPARISMDEALEYFEEVLEL